MNGSALFVMSLLVLQRFKLACQHDELVSLVLGLLVAKLSHFFSYLSFFLTRWRISVAGKC